MDDNKCSERFYRAYVADRDSGMSHAQIVADGVYGAQVEDFAMRYSLAQAAYADAMMRRDREERFYGGDDDRGYSTDGRGLPRGVR